MKTAHWTWTCAACGKTYPPEGYVACKTDAEDQWRYHKNVCPVEEAKK